MNSATAHQYACAGGSGGLASNPARPVPKKYAPAASISSPITCLISSLAGPARGIRLTSAGNAESTKYGSAIPVPIAANVLRVINGVCVADHAAAAPMNGAVQGVE